MVRLKAGLLLAACLLLVVELCFIFTRTLHRATERLCRHCCRFGSKRSVALMSASDAVRIHDGRAIPTTSGRLGCPHLA